MMKWEGEPPMSMDRMDVQPNEDGTYASVIIVPCGHRHKDIKDALDCQWKRCMKWRKRQGGEAQFSVAHRPDRKRPFTFFLPMSLGKRIAKYLKKKKRRNLGLAVPHDF